MCVESLVQVAIGHVSIHATRCRVAKPSAPLHHRRHKSFQSTPPVAGWRSLHSRWKDWMFAGFNPRHPLPGGEAGRTLMLGLFWRVSIHATRCRVAKPNGMLGQGSLRKFQSTPPVAGWRSDDFTLSGAWLDMFQSTPPVAGWRSVYNTSAWPAIPLFQSTPPVAGWRSPGRCRAED